jgi:hypothetical protein
MTDLPIACDLTVFTPEERRAHEARSERLFAHQRTASEALTDGYRFAFAASALAEVSAFIAGERRCCPFFSFTLELPAGAEVVYLSLRGPDGVKALLRRRFIFASP